MCPILRSIQENNCSHGSYYYGVRHFFLIFWSLMQEFTTPSGVPFHVFIAKAADGTASILEEAGTGLGIIPWNPMNHLVDLVGGDWNMAIIFHIYHILGMSSSQLTFIFFRGVETTNQLWLEGVLGIFLMVWRGSFPENARFSYSTWNVWKYHWEYSNISRVNYLPWPHDRGNKHPLTSYDLGYHPGPRVLTHSHSTMNWDSVEFDTARFDSRSVICVSGD